VRDGTAQLDAFGRKLIDSVRDRTLDDIDLTLTGMAQAGWEQELSRQISSSLDRDGVLLARHLVVIAIDTALHNLLWMLETSDQIRLVAKAPDGAAVDLADVSDGLSGELWTEDGWIARFSSDSDKGQLDPT
jgi:hypothetical protein